MRIDLSNKSRQERKEIFSKYIKSRLFHSKQAQVIDVKSMRKRFKVSHLREKDRIDSFLHRMLTNEIYPLQIKIADEYRLHKIKQRSK